MNKVTTAIMATKIRVTLTPIPAAALGVKLWLVVSFAMPLPAAALGVKLWLVVSFAMPLPAAALGVKLWLVVSFEMIVEVITEVKVVVMGWVTVIAKSVACHRIETP
jgi:hypothetical protein